MYILLVSYIIRAKPSLPQIGQLLSEFSHNTFFNVIAFLLSRSHLKRILNVYKRTPSHVWSELEKGAYWSYTKVSKMPIALVLPPLSNYSLLVLYDGYLYICSTVMSVKIFDELFKSHSSLLTDRHSWATNVARVRVVNAVSSVPYGSTRSKTRKMF